MKFKINKACDLSSISVFPPRRSNGMSTGAEGLGRSHSSQIRSQSQQSFSQGMSQLSQNSFDDNLIGDQEQILRIIIDSDEESDRDFSCFIRKEEPAKESRIMDEVQEDTLSILQKARKRRRKYMNSVVEV